ncbi:hypothetical protein AVEN_266485-1 [Araneus ventricosus]|uniref:Protein FAM199X n=1 Tax=Araneus ventricosus TaxID=182803 RepID=A0A4Y2E1B5_ARAVE|nr:hypothetical protein AVEN_266485-1 [Araneus ventricosus]
MIESSIMSSSIWDSELFQTGNTLDASSHLDLNCDFDSTRDGLLSGYSTPNDTSSCSSDYDGFVMLDEFDNFFPLSDSFVSEILDNSITGISELDRVSSVDSPQKDSSVSSYNPGTVQRNAVDYLLTSKLWSHMSPEEQLNTLHALSEVTYHMGLREQMEIIKIIDPTAIIAPDCKEFALDSTNLDDLKLKKITNFVIKQRLHLKNSSQSLNNFSSLSSKNKNSSSSKLLSRKNSNATYARTKRKSQKKQRNILFHGEEKKKNLKRQKQTRKERRSGFFVYEKKMVINRALEDEDINILE